MCTREGFDVTTLMSAVEDDTTMQTTKKLFHLPSRSNELRLCSKVTDLGQFSNPRLGQTKDPLHFRLTSTVSKSCLQRYQGQGVHAVELNPRTSDSRIGIVRGIALWS
jgi:hypothetical protein